MQQEDSINAWSFASHHANEFGFGNQSTVLLLNESLNLPSKSKLLS